MRGTQADNWGSPQSTFKHITHFIPQALTERAAAEQRALQIMRQRRSKFIALFHQKIQPDNFF